MGDNKNTEYVVSMMNLVFSMIYGLEALIKITAYGLNYFRDSWNQFDFVVTIFSCVLTPIELFTPLDTPGALHVIRIIRISRILNQFEMFKSMRLIVETLK